MRVIIRVPNYAARVKAWARDVCQQAEAWRGEDWFFNGKPGTNPDDALLAWYVCQVLAERAHHALMAAVCARLDHVWIVDGEGGPENPYVDVSCSRCGTCQPRRWW